MKQRKAVRYKSIEVEYMDISFQKQRRKFFGYMAQIIQHEMDHWGRHNLIRELIG